MPPVHDHKDVAQPTRVRGLCSINAINLAYLFEQLTRIGLRSLKEFMPSI
ncbi:hypothetical protein ABIA58_002496 [Pseudomonas frederiksbergensis]